MNKISLKNFIFGSKDHFEFTGKIDIDSYELCARDIVFNKPPIINLSISKKFGNLNAKISVDLDTTLFCVRCLDSFAAKSAVKFEGVLLNEDDMLQEDAIIMNDNEIDLYNLLDIALLEHVNDNLYCKDNCKGLCSICGANLNHTSCDCHKISNNINPELEKLKELTFD